MSILFKWLNRAILGFCLLVFIAAFVSYYLASRSLPKYDKKLITKNDLEGICDEIRKDNINGLNVTVPFKKEIIPFLDQLSKEAEETQSVNTVYIKDNKIIGHNTDIEGFELNIKNTKFNATGKKFFIIVVGMWS